MFKTDILGSIVVCLVLFALIGYGVYIRLELEWAVYLKYLGAVVGIGLVVGILAATGKKSSA